MIKKKVRALALARFCASSYPQLDFGGSQMLDGVDKAIKKAASSHTSITGALPVSSTRKTTRIWGRIDRGIELRSKDVPNN